MDKSEDDSFSDPPDVTGLTDAEVAERVARGEVNDFEARVGRTYWDIFTTNIFNIFNVTLFLLLLIVLIAQEYTTVLFAGFSVVGNSLIGTVQELMAKRRLEKLAQLSAQDVAVIRNGERITIPSRQIVKDDVIPITPGDRLAVDGRLIYRDALEIDESHLTGESEAVYKDLDAPLYSGSFCVAGSGMMAATQVGRRSTVNRLAAQAKAYKNPLTPTQERIATLVGITLIVMFGFAPMLAVNGYLTQIGFLEIVKNAVVFVTSLVPQGLILVTIISLSIGAVKISRHQTLIQRVNAVESLANVTVLCFDKTGTITENRLGVERIIPLNGTGADDIQDGLRHYVANVSSHNSTVSAIADHLAQAAATGKPPRKLREIPFTSGRKWGAIVLPDTTLILGAPERVLTDADAEGAGEYFRRGMRVLAFARMPNPPDDGHLSPEIEPLALIVMRDQVRHDIHDTLNAFREQNVRLKVISGDNIETVRAVSGLAGMPIDVAYTGTELDAMSDHELEEAVRRADVFARIEPDTKRRIVAALQRLGEYVAMVGDGVNDVPALKEANLAIVMNDGAQISKDVADIVLLNNAMSTLPRAFAEGTRITQTIFGTTKMFLTKNFYNTLLFICVGFMAMPFPISPVQISWSSFGTVNMPATLMALGILRPQKITEFRRDVLDYIVTAGVIGAAGMAFMYLCVLSYVQDEDQARGAITVAFLLYGLMIVWNVHGIDVLRPRTFLQFPLVAVFSTGLTAIVTIAASIFPETFDFYWPPAEALVLVVAIQLLCMTMVSFAMRRRGFINGVWQMVEK
jgi:cation-transporting ATPase E